MQLPDFIKRSVAFFEKAEKQFEATEAAKTRISELEAAAGKAAKELSDSQAASKDLQSKLDKANTDLAARDTEITKLKGEAVKEKGRANATIAGQGVPVDQVPASDPSAGVPANESAWNKYQRLLVENPREAGAFYAQSGDKIMASRFEQK